MLQIYHIPNHNPRPPFLKWPCRDQQHCSFQGYESRHERILTRCQPSSRPVLNQQMSGGILPCSEPSSLIAPSGPLRCPFSLRSPTLAFRKACCQCHSTKCYPHYVEPLPGSFNTTNAAFDTTIIMRMRACFPSFFLYNYNSSCWC
jgi:hypothetical protein